MRGFETLSQLDGLLTPEALACAQVERDALIAAGLPFDRPLRELGDPEPEAYGLGVEEFRFGPLEVLGLPAAIWSHRAHRADTWWTHAFEARFWLEEDAGRNQAAVLAVLEGRYGEGRRKESASTWRVRWPGLIEVHASGWLPAAEIPANNAYLKRTPRLMTSVAVELYSPLRTARATPGIEERVCAAERLPAASPQVRAHRSCLHLHGTRLELDVGTVWRDDAGIGVSTPAASVVIPGALQGLRLVEMRPARGRGGTWMELLTEGPSLPVGAAKGHRDLRERARRLAETLDVPLQHVEQDDV